MTIHPRDEREWRRTVERKLSQTAAATAGVAASVPNIIVDELIPLAGKKPTAPIELVAQTMLYQGANGYWQGRTTIDFPDVTESVDDYQIEISHYELWAVDLTQFVNEGGLEPTTYIQVSSSVESSVRHDGLEPGSTWKYKIRAIGVESLVPGQFSTPIQVRALADTLPPPQPTKPVASSVRGTIKVSWDGMAVTGQMPGDFRFAELAAGTEPNPTEVVAYFGTEGGFTIISDLEYYDTMFFRLRAVDFSGNYSAWSEQDNAYIAPLVDEDIILSQIDAAETQLINVDASVSILSDTILTRHLTITEDMTVALLAAHKIIAGDIAANAIEAQHIVSGAVTAQKLEADLALISRIIAGPELGTHAELTPSGLRVYAADPNDGIPNEVIRMGVANSGDYLAVTSANDLTVASISDGGVGSFSKVITDDITYKGYSLADLLDRAPRGPLYKSELAGAIDGITGEIGLITAEFYADGTDRQRQLDAGVSFYPSGTATEAYFRFTYTTDGSQPTVNSSQLLPNVVTGGGTIGMGRVSADTWDHKNWTHHFRWSELGSSFNAPGTRVRILFILQKGNGDQLNVRPGHPTYFHISDVGAGLPHTPHFTPGGGSAFSMPPTINPSFNFTKQYACTGSMSYAGNNSQYLFNNTRMYQGLSPTGNGNYKSIALFPRSTIMNDLSGATIWGVRVYFYFEHWYYSKGGTAQIGFHGMTSLPSTYGGVNGLARVVGQWPKPGGQWVDIGELFFNGFKTGTNAGGVYLLGDSTYNTYGIAQRPILEISYSK